MNSKGGKGGPPAIAGKGGPPPGVGKGKPGKPPPPKGKGGAKGFQKGDDDFGSGGKGKGKPVISQVAGQGAAAKPKPFEDRRDAFDNFDPGLAGIGTGIDKGEGKGKGTAKGKKGKKMGKLQDEFMKQRRGKGAVVRETALEDVDFEVPKLAVRTHKDNLIEGEVDPKVLTQMRNAHLSRVAEVQKMHDPATFKRSYKCHLSVVAIQNSTAKKWETFMAISMEKAGSSRNNHRELRGNYSYSRSYVIGPGDKKKLKNPERVFTRTFTGNYKELKDEEFRIDLWIVVKRNFNQHLGTATKNLYECGCEPVSQSVKVKGFKSGTSSHQTYDVGLIFLSALVAERFQYGITLQNWQFIPAASMGRDSGNKMLIFNMPTGTGAMAPIEVKQTGVSSGPRYGWVKCGVYSFIGTKVDLECSAFRVDVISDGTLQGKAVISLGGAGDFPIASGTVKKLTDNVKLFLQGRVGGGIAVSSRSLLLESDRPETNPSIPPPLQPGASVVLYHLNPNLQYLIVEVKGAEGLPVADVDAGTSNPFVRVRYDGTIQQSDVVEGNLRPVWNQIFYIPVRYYEIEILHNKRYLNTLLPEELKSKGFLELEVWHHDGVPTEFLGSFKLDLRMSRFGKDDTRSVAEKYSKHAESGNPDEEHDEEAGEDDDATQGIDIRLTKKHRTKVYVGSRHNLTGSRLQSHAQPKISFECFFVPDFPSELNFPEQPTSLSIAQQFTRVSQKWADFWPSFSNDYMAWFPDSPATRTWPANFTDAKGELKPLPFLLQALALPQSLSQPGDVLHWVRCIEFLVPAKQRSKGKLDRWQTTEFTLALRKGAVQDHAVLLCCALLGMRKDAWVCKGTVHGNREHVWCMTREKGGTVTFWETATGAKYHLPKRWSDDTAHGPKMREIARQRLASRRIRPDWKEQAQMRRDGGRRVQLLDLDDLTRLPFSPFLELVKPERIVPLPYASIEVVFNPTQLYGNIGNHSPSCIYYDFEGDVKSWMPFMDMDSQALLAQKDVATPVGPAISAATAKELSDNISVEVKESIRMTRIRSGFESVFEDNEILEETLARHLDLLEVEIKLDIDWRTDHTGKAAKPPGHPSPFNSEKYVSGAQEQWREWWKRRQQLDSEKPSLPVRPNHKLSGVPIHFSGADVKEVRYHIMECRAIQEYLEIQSDDVVFFCVTKVFPMASSVASVWCFVGVQIPLTPDEVFEKKIEQEDRRAAEAGKGTKKGGGVFGKGKPGGGKGGKGGQGGKPGGKAGNDGKGGKMSQAGNSGKGGKGGKKK